MVSLILVVLGLCFGSFVNAFVWRLHEQEDIDEQLSALKSKKSTKAVASRLALLKAQKKDRSISTGRSMCTDCHHQLAWYDLLPVISWLIVGGKCRYCRRPISWQYPVVEISTATIFVVSYSLWPQSLSSAHGIFDLSIWLIALIAFMTLVVYDFRWMILPNRVVYPLIALAGTQRLVDSLVFHDGLHALANSGIAAVIGGGIFYVLYQFSDGNWIGGGDVKLGFALGFFVGRPLLALLLLFLASLLGIIGAIPSLLNGKFKWKLQIPFGPCLLLACYLLVLFGASFVGWYMQLLTV